MSLRLSVIGIGLVLGLTSGGCAIGTQKSGRVIDSRQISEVQVGVSTKQDVLDLFGPPNSYTRVGATLSAAGPSLLGRPGTAVGQTPGQGAPMAAQGTIEAKAAEDVFVYEYTEDHESFFTVLLFTYFQRNTISDRLMVFFDTKDVVKYLAFAKQTDAEPEDEE